MRLVSGESGDEDSIRRLGMRQVSGEAGDEDSIRGGWG